MFSLSGAVDTLTPLQVRLMLGMCKTIIGCSPFSSESCSQVFTILLVWLLRVVESIPRDKWGSVVLAYDNMCHLDSLKVARKPLPLPKPFDEMWLAITKVR